MMKHPDHEKKVVRRVFLVLPAYNEERALPSLLKRLGDVDIGLSRGLAVFVVDDGSTDRTAAFASNGISPIKVNLISHERNMGLGQAVQTGIQEVLRVASDNDVIIIMDADDTHDVNLFAPMLKKIQNGADVVIASRFVEGGDHTTAPLFRRILSKGASLVFRKLLPLNGIYDFTSGYRAYTVRLMRRVAAHWGERLVEEQGFACMVELLLKLRHWSPAIAETPMHLRYDRKLGASKLKLGRTMIQYLKLGLRDRLSPPPRQI